MKLLALTQRTYVESTYNEVRDTLDQQWSEFVRLAGYLPLILPNNDKVAMKLIKRYQPAGLIFTGGNSLYKYGGDSPKRDCIEKELLEYAIETRLPVLGVCRGMQVIQDWFEIELKPVKGHVTKKMEIVCSNGNTILKNSYHSMGTVSSCDSFLIDAFSKDGIIKAISHSTCPIEGIMWHPERETPFELDDIERLQRLFG